jgi:hypothetical protein
MKKIAVFLLLILSASFQAFGQKFSIGFKPSFLIVGAKYTMDPEVIRIKITKRGSYAFGITIREQISKLIGIKIEPRFMAKGYNIYWGQGHEDIYRNNSLSIPVLFYVSPIHNLNFEFGPELCHLLNSKAKSFLSKSFQDNNSSDQKPFELSLVTGVSYSFLKKFDFGARYAFGITAFEKGSFIIFNGTGPPPHYKIVQNYFEFYLSTSILTKTKNN